MYKKQGNIKTCGILICVQPLRRAKVRKSALSTIENFRFINVH